MTTAGTRRVEWSLRRVLAAAVLCLAAPIVVSAQSQWIQQGPAGGLMWTIEVDPTDSSIVYVGTHSGVFRSIDAGSTWTPINNGLTSPNIVALAIDPGTPSTLFAGSMWNGVFRSTDSGATWTPVGTGLPAGEFEELRALEIDSELPSTLYAGTSDGVYRSVDGGDTWVLVNQGMGSGSGRDVNIASLAIDPHIPSIVYAAGAGILYRSENGGDSWVSIYGSLPRVRIEAVTIDPVTPSTLYLAANELTNGGLYRSTDSGGTWTRLFLGSVKDAAIDPDSPSTLYVATFFAGVYRTTNGGLDWSNASAGLTDLEAVSLEIDPETPSRLYLGTISGLFRSENGASAWSLASDGINALPISVLAVDPQTPSTMFAGGWGARLQETKGIYRTRDAGATWSLVGLQGVEMISIAIDPQNPSIVYAGGEDAGFFRSTDAGASWTPINSGLPDLPPWWRPLWIAVDPENSSTLYALIPELYRSDNSGTSWTRVASNGLTNASKLIIDPTSTSTLYALRPGRVTAPDGSGVFRSTDAGLNWTPVINGFPVPSNPGPQVEFAWTLAMDPINPSILYVGTEGTTDLGYSRTGGVYRTTDRGDHWVRVSDGLPDFPVTSLAVDPVNPSIVYAGTFDTNDHDEPIGAGVFRTANSGTTWAPFNTGLTNLAIGALAIDPLDSANLSVGTYGNSTFRWRPDGLPQPIVTGITPSTAVTGMTIDAVISGQNLFNPTAVVFSGDGVTAVIAGGGTATSLPVSITIDLDAAPGPRTLTVESTTGTTSPLGGFSVVRDDSVAPGSGTGAAATFTAHYYDPLGASNIGTVYLAFATAPGVTANTCMVRYDRAAGLLSLRDDAGAWQMGSAIPGTGVRRNGQCAISLSASSATSAGLFVTLRVAVAFTPAYAGTRGIYIDSTSAGGVSEGWRLMGSWSVPALAVEAISVTPNAASGWYQQPLTFAMQYSDSHGAADLSSTAVRFGTSAGDGAGTCTASYEPTTGAVALLNDAGTGWTAGTLGSGTLTNSQCTLNLAASSANLNGNALNVALNISFTRSFAGLKTIYMLATSAQGPSTGWVPKGTWLAHSIQVSVQPSVGAGLSQVFSVLTTDSAGSADISFVNLGFGPAFQVTGVCLLVYLPGSGILRLVNDAGTAWSEAPLGSGTLANSQCAVNLANSSATASGELLTFLADITFSASFAGRKPIVLSGVSASGRSSGNVEGGAWTVGPSAPVVEAFSVSPNSGVGMVQSFSLHYADSLGASNLSSAQVRFGLDPATCTVWYDATTGVVRLLNDAGTVWQQGAFGNGTLANSRCTLNLAASSAAASGTNVTLRLHLSFSAGFSGVKSISMRAANASVDTGWVFRGSWTVPGQPPATVAAVSVAPNSGTGATQAFTLAYTDDAGITADLTAAQVRFLAIDGAAGACVIHYRATTSRVRIQDNTGVWSPFTSLGAGSLSNSYCTLNLATSVAVASGNNLTLTLSLSFSTSFAGPKAIAMRAASAGGATTGWVDRGTWTVGALVQAISASPNGATGAAQTFTLAYSDSLGASADLRSAQVRFGAANVASGVCTVIYNATTAQVRLQDDVGVSGPWTSFGSGTLSNSQCSLDLTASGASASGSALTVTLRLSFNTAFAGAKSIYMRGTSNYGSTSGWITRGTFTVGAVVGAISSTPSSGTGITRAFALAYSDSLGATADLRSAQVRFGASNVAAGTCTVTYNAMTGLARIQDDMGVSGPWTPLGVGTLSNSQCSVDLGQSSAITSGNDLTLNLHIRFNAAFLGTKNIYMRATSDYGSTTGWVTRGTFTVDLVLSATSITPNNGTGTTQAFTLAFSDSAGVAADLRAARVRFAGATGPTCIIDYNAITDRVRIQNDDGSWGPFVPLGGGSDPIFNSQCSLNLASSSALRSGTNLTLTLDVTFTPSPAFSGAKTISMRANSDTGLTTGFQNRGTWTVPPPLNVSSQEL